MQVLLNLVINAGEAIGNRDGLITVRTATRRVDNPYVRMHPEAAALAPGERWFVSHLVSIWYLGVYYHEQRSIQRITSDGALMYEAVRGLLPAPYVERRNCRFAERRKVDSFQRSYTHSEGGGGKLSFLHNRAEPGSCLGARLSAGSFGKIV